MAKKKPTERRVHAVTYPEIDRREWHFVKNFSFDTIINVFGVALVLGMPIFYWTRVIDSKVLSLEVINAEAAKSEIRRDIEIREQRVNVNLRLDKIEDRVAATQLAIEKLGANLQNLQPPRLR
jgi:hypothetical protein